VSTAGSFSTAVSGVQGWARRRLLLTQTVGNAGLNTATLVLNFVIALVLSRLLGPDGYGAYAFAVAVSTILTVPGLLGLPAVVVREIARYRVAGEWGIVRGLMRRSNQAVLAISGVVVIALVVVVALVGWPEGDLRAPTVLALPLIPLVALVSLRQSMMQGFGRVVLGRVPETVVGPLLVLVAVVALELGLAQGVTASWAVVASVGSYGAAALLGAMLLKRTVPAAVRAAKARFATRAWALAALPLLISGGLGTLNAQIGTVLVGSVAGAREAGIFSVATRAAGFVPFFLLAAVPTLMPVIAELHARGQRERLQLMLTRAARGVLLASLPAAAVLFVFARPILSIFGAEFEAADTSLRILVAAQLVNVATGFSGTILVMIGRSAYLTGGVLAGTLVNVVLTSLLVPSLGADGASIGLASSFVVSNTVMVILLWRVARIYAPALGTPMRT
jgi:O-antigen/teichoic acid export membrane protein